MFDLRTSSIERPRPYVTFPLHHAQPDFVLFDPESPDDLPFEYRPSLLAALAKATEYAPLRLDDLPRLTEIDHPLTLIDDLPIDRRCAGHRYWREVTTAARPAGDNPVPAFRLGRFLPRALPASRLMLRVSILHQLGSYTKAADAVLNLLIDLMEKNDFSGVDDLLSEYAYIFSTESSMQDARGAALALNLLSLTRRYASQLRNRPTLREILRSCVTDLDGPAAASALVANL